MNAGGVGVLVLGAVALGCPAAHTQWHALQVRAQWAAMLAISVAAVQTPFPSCEHHSFRASTVPMTIAIAGTGGAAAWGIPSALCPRDGPQRLRRLPALISPLPCPHLTHILQYVAPLHPAVTAH